MSMNEEQLRFKMEAITFEGPLDLLLSIVSKNKMSIYDIEISLLFSQYMDYIQRMQDMDMEVAGEFIDMASRLMLIKSRMILPRDESDEKDDPRRELIDVLVEHQRAKENAGRLLPLYMKYSSRMTKETDEVGVDKTFVADQDCMVLMEAFERIMRRQRIAAQSITAEPQKTLNTILTKKITPVPVKYFAILRHLYKHGETDFESLLLTCKTRSDLIALFMALLQLIRNQLVYITSENDGNPVLNINKDRSRSNI